MTTLADLQAPARLVRTLPIDHAPFIVDTAGGERSGRERLQTFVRDEIAHYDERRNHPDDDAGSHLSPWLHFGHVSPHGVLRAIAGRYDFGPDRLGPQRSGSRDGFWGLPASVEAFLDELVTWREIGLNFCTHRRDGDRLESLPAWAQQTIAAHAGDPRPVLYDLATLEAAHTHDELWNAAQRQLRHTGTMHNYLRMLWGKLVITWSPSAREALQWLVELNNRWSIDGRDPNSYSGIFWVFGRYDRAWPERAVFGQLRCMTSASTRRKLRVKAYLERWAAPAGGTEPVTGRAGGQIALLPEADLADRAVPGKARRGRSRG
jgi:deoxyribodipyrimidine photo-lyase